MLLIGSYALGNHFVLDKPPLDLDFICTIEDYEQLVAFGKKEITSTYPTSPSSMVIKWEDGSISEYSIAWPGTTNEELLKLFEQQVGVPVATPEVLLMLKLSHRYKKNNPHFLKTMRDIQFLRSKGVTLSKELKALLKRREKETYTYAHPNLSQGKQSFFKESDKLYKYEHDDIHVAVADLGIPAYTLFSMDGQEVKVDKKKWLALPREEQLRAGLEESYVLAIERSLIPHPGVKTPKEAFDMALEKVCTSITSGWFREFCWENYDAIQSLYDESYYAKFLAALDAGQIREFGKA